MNDLTKPLRAAIYARVSTLDKGQDIGLQVDELTDAVTQRKWRLVEVYSDEGISGATTRRPALDRMLAAAQAGRFDVLLAWKLDRVGRSLTHVLHILETLDHLGVAFVSLRDPGLDSSTPTGRLMTALVGAFAAYEREIIRERVIAGVRRAQAAGKHCGRPRVEIDVRPAVALLKEHRSLKECSAILSIPRATLRRRLQEVGKWPFHPDVTTTT